MDPIAFTYEKKEEEEEKKKNTRRRMEVCLVERSIQHTQWCKIPVGKNLIPCAANNTREKLLNRRKDAHKIDLDKSEGIVDDEQQQRRRRVDITTS